MNDFLQTINFCAATIDLLIKNSSDHRQISEFNSNNNRGRRGYGHGKRGGHRGGYTGAGRGRQKHDNSRGGRNPRGRGHGRFRGRDYYNNRENNQTLSRGYLSKEWQNLSQAVHNRIYQVRDRVEMARTVAAITHEQNEVTPDDISTITPSINNPGGGTGQNDNGNHCNTAQVSVQGIRSLMNHHQSSIGAYNWINRRFVSISSISQNYHRQHAYRAKLDSHADTYGVNGVAYIIEYMGKVAEVYGFSKSLSAMEDVPIIKAALAYDDPKTGETTEIIVNQALYFCDKLTNILIKQNQMRTNGLIVHDCPRHLSKGRSQHAIMIEDENYVIPLKLHGIMSYFEQHATGDLRSVQSQPPAPSANRWATGPPTNPPIAPR
jgi:hypothetical protein